MPHPAHAAMREATRGPRRRRRPAPASRETEAGTHPRGLDIERVADRDEGAEPRGIVGSEPRFDLGEDDAAPTIGRDEMHAYAERAVCLTIVNPNNPDGRIVERSRLLALHDSLAQHGGMLIVDEAFADVAPEVSVAAVAGAASGHKLIVLRSFGKFFGLAGLRLGFIVAAPALAATIRGLIGEWPVCSDALAAGLAAYADGRWMDRERAILHKSAQRLDDLLTRSGFELAGGTSLFRLARAADARERFTRLLAAGILVRPFDFAPDLLRFGLPRGREQWRRLAVALSARA